MTRSSLLVLFLAWPWTVAGELVVRHPILGPLVRALGINEQISVGQFHSLEFVGRNGRLVLDLETRAERAVTLVKPQFRLLGPEKEGKAPVWALLTVEEVAYPKSDGKKLLRTTYRVDCQLQVDPMDFKKALLEAVAKGQRLRFRGTSDLEVAATKTKTLRYREISIELRFPAACPQPFPLLRREKPQDLLPSGHLD
ncbi:MAG: hypothetical protein AAF555_03730 [Verrucomicrobiota bacterium]